jgi:hypothetical protein
MNSPVFFDETGRRRRLVGRITGLLLAIVAAGAILFATTIVDVPKVSPLSFGHEREQPLRFRTHLARFSHHRLLRPMGRGKRAVVEDAL